MIRINTGDINKKILIKFDNTEIFALLVNYKNQNKLYDEQASIQLIAIFSLNNALFLPTN